MTILPLARTCVLEVERKFHSLAVRELASTQANPSFLSIQPRSPRTIHDEYYDRHNLLSSAGVWVRRRNGQWEAKIKKGGTYINSRFQELSDHHDIAKCVAEITGSRDSVNTQFGLERIADLITFRKSWIADGEFKITVDTTDFGHVVGEVELEQRMKLVRSAHDDTEQEMKKIMREMDLRIAEFMERYSWAFHPGIPKGKLTAYFDRYKS